MLDVNRAATRNLRLPWVTWTIDVGSGPARHVRPLAEHGTHSHREGSDSGRDVRLTRPDAGRSNHGRELPTNGPSAVANDVYTVARGLWLRPSLSSDVPSQVADLVARTMTDRGCASRRIEASDTLQHSWA
jgi:hypothetical protein